MTSTYGHEDDSLTTANADNVDQLIIVDWDTKIPHDGWITKWKYTVDPNRVGYPLYLMIWRPVCTKIQVK